MKKIIFFFILVQMSSAFSQQKNRYASAYFERPLSCPLRFSNLSELRDRFQALVSSLGNDCTQSGQQALNQFNSSVTNLEGIASTWSTQQGSDQTAQNAQLAKNAGQLLGSLNVITSNNACFYDIHSRGALPVIADIVMSLSQLGLLIHSPTGTLVASGGFIAGSGLKIINQLVKKKFNWNRPEERRAFLQLNCAFFDNRRVIEEMGLFNPETKSFRESLAYGFKKERLQLIKLQKEHELAIVRNEALLNNEMLSIDTIVQSGLNPILSRKLDELSASLASRPTDYASKWKQVSVLVNLVPQIKEMLKKLKLEGLDGKAVKIMLNNIEIMSPDMGQDGKLWTSSIDDYEIKYRGPILAFSGQISEAIKKGVSYQEAEVSAENKQLATRIYNLRKSIKESKSLAWGASQRLVSVEAKIVSLEAADGQYLFSQNDEGKSDAVEILDHYRKLQKSILGKEGKGYLKNSMENMDDVLVGLKKHLNQFGEASEGKERCAAAEKLKFVWAQYRFKTQESYDFIATNLDLYRSSYKIGKEYQRRATTYVLKQIESVEELEQGEIPIKDSVGFYMRNVKQLISEVEGKLENSDCF